MKILCCGIFPALQRTLELKTLKPGSVNRVRSVTRSVGGKATHAARVLKTLGTDPLLFGFAGGETGETIKHLLDEEGLHHAFVETEAETRICQTLLADDADDFTELVEDASTLSTNDWKNLIRQFQRVREERDALIVSGTLPAHAPTEIYAELIQSADVPVILDTSGAPLLAALEHQPTLIKINATELQKTTGISDIGEAAQELIAQGAGAVGITQGADSALLVTPVETIRFSIPPVEVKSALGCGDSVNAGIAFSLGKGNSLTEAFVFGLACGTSNAQTALPGIIHPEQLANLAQKIKIDQ